MAESDESKVPAYLATHTIRLSQNLSRVDSLINLHEFLEPMVQHIEDRPPEVNDILRSATVLLHASLEDFLRSVASAHLPRTDPSRLKNMTLADLGNPHQTKFGLSDLMPHRGKDS